MKLIITFPSTTMALYMEKICKECKKDGRIIPLPKEISAGCGLVWMTRDLNQDTWNTFLKEKSIKYEKMVELEI